MSCGRNVNFWYQFLIDDALALIAARVSSPTPSPIENITTYQYYFEKYTITAGLDHKITLQSNTMAAIFEPLLSTSAMRPPFASADAPSMADSLPSINFGFDELRDRMARFTAKFDNFIEEGRKRVLEERNQFRMNVAELKGMWMQT